MPDTNNAIPLNLARLRAGEEFLRGKAIGLIVGDERLRLHLAITEAAMDLADVLRQFDTADEDPQGHAAPRHAHLQCLRREREACSIGLQPKQRSHPA